jgi:hypothetical protein
LSLDKALRDFCEVIGDTQAQPRQLQRPALLQPLSKPISNLKEALM